MRGTGRLGVTCVILPVDRNSVLLLKGRLRVRMGENVFEEKTSSPPCGLPGELLNSMKHHGSPPGHFCKGSLVLPVLRKP